MTKPSYTKSHKSYDEQVDQLISRGMVINDRDLAIRTLQQVNYYRLGVYWYSYETDHVTHQLRAGTHFEDVVALYEFDRKLRLMVLDAIERIEVSFRAQWTYHLSKHHGCHAHMNESIHNQAWLGTLSELSGCINRPDEEFINSFMEKYSNASPPIWAVSEIMSFGLLSKWFKNLQDNAVRKDIARIYGLHPDTLSSWLQNLTVVRNNCAHHSRLWNRRFGRVRPTIPRRNPKFAGTAFCNQDPLSNSLTLILYLLDIISPGHDWRTRFIALVNSHPTVPLNEMGFVTGWQTHPIWR